MYIKTATRKVFLDIDMQSTIQRLKQELEVVEGIPTEEQRLIFSGRQLLDGEKTLSECGLTTQDQTILVLRQTNSNKSITLFVRTIQRELDFKLTVSLSDRIERIRTMINEKVNLPSTYSLVYKGIVLTDQQTVLDYGISDRSSIYIVTQIVMEVENLNGERIKMKINDHRITGEVVERLVEQRRAHKIQQRKRKHTSQEGKDEVSGDDPDTSSHDVFPPFTSRKFIEARKRSRVETEPSDDTAHDRDHLHDVQTDPSLHVDVTEGSNLPAETFVDIPALELAHAAPRCNKCCKKIGLTGIQCRCDKHFCSAHRYPEEHECPFDYRTKAKEELVKQNPRVIATKVIPIAK